MHPPFLDELTHSRIHKWVTGFALLPRIKLCIRLVIAHLGKLGGVIIFICMRIIKKYIGIKLTPSNLFTKSIVGFAIT